MDENLQITKSHTPGSVFSLFDSPFNVATDATGNVYVADHGSSTVRKISPQGTVTTLASLHLGLPQYDRSAVDGVIVPTASMREISQRLAHISPAERIAVPCIGRERADLVVELANLPEFATARNEAARTLVVDGHPDHGLVGRRIAHAAHSARPAGAVRTRSRRTARRRPRRLRRPRRSSSG